MARGNGRVGRHGLAAHTPLFPDGRWRGDSRELYYWSDGGLYAVAVRADAEGWEQGAPELLLTGDYRLHSDNYVSWDTAPDGQSFYLIRDEGPPGWQPTRVELVLNGRELVEQVLASAPH